MPFPFKHLVELFETLDTALVKSHDKFDAKKSSKSKKALGAKSKRGLKAKNEEIIRAWFAQHDDEIDRSEPSALAFLSCLLPHRLPQRVYGLKERRLSRLICRALKLPTKLPSRGGPLLEWENSEFDFATCLEKEVMIWTDLEHAAAANRKPVTVEEIDKALIKLAALSGFTTKPNEETLESDAEDEDRAKILGRLLNRLQGHEAKWLVRMIFKSFNPLEIDDYWILESFHFLLPRVVLHEYTLEGAVKVFGLPEVIDIPHHPPQADRRQYHNQVAPHLGPKLCVMIKRKEYWKARKFDDCFKMAKGRTMSVERKYDGYFCQIHVYRAGKDLCYKVFSKSGKDQTSNWSNAHEAIELGLRLNTPECVLEEGCVVDAEMFIYNTRTKAIQPFHKIRKHTEFFGRTIGTIADSPLSPDERTMLAFYDCLKRDERYLVDEPLSERRQHLEDIVKPIEGVSILGERQVIDFASRGAEAELTEYFQFSKDQRWEGLVLKGCNDPYILKGRDVGAIKLKKDLIGEGDEVNLCILGGRKDKTEVMRLGGPLLWTAFYLACLTNKEAVVAQPDTRPEFLIIDVLTHHNMSDDTLRELNSWGGGHYEINNQDLHRDLRRPDLPIAEPKNYNARRDQPEIVKSPPEHWFTEPMVVEVTGAGFDKPEDASYFVLRFPRNLQLKIHSDDRPVTETDSFREIQKMARASFLPVGAQEHQQIDWYQESPRATPSPSYVSGTGAGDWTPTPLTNKSAGNLGFPESPLQNRGNGPTSGPGGTHTQSGPITVPVTPSIIVTPFNEDGGSHKSTAGQLITSVSTASVATESPSPMAAIRNLPPKNPFVTPTPPRQIIDLTQSPDWWGASSSAKADNSVHDALLKQAVTSAFVTSVTGASVSTTSPSPERPVTAHSASNPFVSSTPPGQPGAQSIQGVERKLKGSSLPAVTNKRSKVKHLNKHSLPASAVPGQAQGVKRRLEDPSLPPAASKRAKSHNTTTINTTSFVANKPRSIAPRSEPPSSSPSTAKSSRSQEQASSAAKQDRRPLGELKNLSSTHGLRKAAVPNTFAKRKMAPVDASQENAPGKPLATTGHQAMPPLCFPLDRTIFETLQFESADEMESDPAADRVHWITIPKMNANDADHGGIPAEAVQNLRAAVNQAYVNYWGAKKAAAPAEADKTQLPTPPSTAPPTQRRLLLFYDQAIEPSLQKDISKDGMTIPDIHAVLTRPENKQFYIRGLLLTARDDTERIEMRDFTKYRWKDCMASLGEMPCNLTFCVCQK